MSLSVDDSNYKGWWLGWVIQSPWKAKRVTRSQHSLLQCLRLSEYVTKICRVNVSNSSRDNHGHLLYLIEGRGLWALCG